ncbi:hypothetical protein LAZ67_13001433 [Cordylochernes scorpioides]|uniref:RNase H type-1 domain-containing protein n=1 Tax=Cordylochernes scorpioides TaxID=51811 RepID=A0ABY6L5R2_9ARAC|nr:hypothetical protein LAZ67_13001433 [Cordylochernes scorpioides]
MELNQYDGGGGGSQQANKRPRSEDEDLLPSSHHQFKYNSTANLFNFECQTFEAIIADTSLDSPEKIQMATKGLILTLVQEAELLLKDAFKGASLGRPNPTANVPIPSTSFASVVAEKDKPVKPAPPKPKAKSTFVNLAPSFESHVVVRVDGEVRDDEICESFRSNHSVQSLLEKREIRVVHRSNNAAHSTSTVFIEVDNQVAEILGAYIPSGIVARSNLHPIPLTSPDHVITSIAICLEQSIIVVHSAYWHGLRAADDFIPLLEDTIRRTSLPVILGMDTNAHSPTWGIGARLDFRGANLEEFASFNDFHFLGPPVDSTWSNGPLSSSIDVTLASSSLAIHVTRGLFDEMAFTDHIPIWTTFLDMVNNETKSSWVESSCKEQTFKSFLNSSLHQLDGASAWGGRALSSEGIRQLRSLHSNFAKCVLRGGPYTPTVSAISITGSPPFDIIVRSRTAFLKEINEGNFESRPGPASLPYPPDRRQLSFSLNIEEITTPIIFTDGSKNEAGVGAAIVPSSEDQQPVLLRLYPDCTAFQAELLAIRWAVRLVKEGYSRNAITIASDCRSALSAICTSGPVRSTLVAKIILALNTNQNVNLCWVPGHCGIDGKERADRAAKNAAVLILEPSFSILPRSLARNHSRAAALDAWTEVYCQDHYNRHLRRIAHTPDRLLQFLPKNVEAIETLSTYGEVSARQVSRQTGISYGTVWRALRIFLKKYPYKIQRFHELKVGDFEKRQEFAAWVFRQIDIDENWLSNVLWTDEAHFSLNGEVNTQNSRIWATENPRIFTEMPLHQPRVTVWCGFTSSFIIGPFFFEEINGRTFKTVSVTGERYVQLLREKVIPILQDRQALSEITFMQDGGPPHISRGAKQLLKDTFGEDRVISRHFIHQWPSRSPDLAPCDFWLWGYIKSRVYRCRPTTLVMLKASIRRHVSSISTDMLFNAVHSVIYRLQAVFENEGRHIEQGL